MMILLFLHVEQCNVWSEENITFITVDEKVSSAHIKTYISARTQIEKVIFKTVECRGVLEVSRKKGSGLSVYK